MESVLLVIFLMIVSIYSFYKHHNTLNLRRKILSRKSCHAKRQWSRDNKTK